MATCNPIPQGEKDFEQEVAKVRKEVEAHFRELIESARSREADLLKEVGRILGEYREKVKEKDLMQKELETTKGLIKQNIQVTGLLDLQRDFVSKIEERVQKIKKEIEAWKISYSRDKDIIEEVKKNGRVSTRSSNQLHVNFKNKLQAIRSFGAIDNAPGQLQHPWGVAIDVNTSRMFIVDHSNNRVQVFSQEGEFLYKFGESMINPIGVVIFQEKVFVTQYNGGSFQVYKLDGTHVKTVGSSGSGEGQLNNPYGIDVNRENGDIYICDTGNQRVQLFSQELNFKQSLWTQTLSRPVDIKLTKESIFVLLDGSNLCLFMYNHNHALVKSFITRGPGKQTEKSFFFCIDGDDNIYMTDCQTGRVNVFDIEGNFIHQFGNFTTPYGISLTEAGTIIICSNTKNKCVQIW